MMNSAQIGYHISNWSWIFLKMSILTEYLDSIAFDV